MMARLIFYVCVAIGGALMVLDGGVHGRTGEFVVGLVIALGAQVMLGTGWWLRWEKTVTWPDDGPATITHVIAAGEVIEFDPPIQIPRRRP